MKAALLVALGLAACTPEVAPGTYYCGPQQACPGDLRCDGVTDTCVLAGEAVAFTCPAGSNLAEPDNDTATANDIGVAGCAAASFSETGCIDKATDVDYVAFTTPSTCTTGHALLRFPVGFAPLTVELLDEASHVVATGTITDDVDASGQTRVELTGPVSGGTKYYVRVRFADDAADNDCGGACAYNWYELSVL